MFRVAIILCLSLISVILALTPVEEAQYYKVYHLSDINLEEFYATRSSKYGGLTKTIENRYSGSIPEDTGGNFGDLEFYNKPKNATLIGRDTITNDDTSQDLVVLYERRYDSYIIDFKVLNFGRQRGWTCRITMYPPTGLVQAEIHIAAGNSARFFVETYTNA